MPTITEIIREQARYVRDSKITVTVDRRLPTVAIEDDTGGSVFLQGDDAEGFLSRADGFWLTGFVVPDDAVYAAAYDYADTL